jgi:hypothetical protein
MIFTFTLSLVWPAAAQVTLDTSKVRLIRPRTAIVDPQLQCYTLSTNGTQYLDSTNSVLAIQVHAEYVGSDPPCALVLMRTLAAAH